MSEEHILKRENYFRDDPGFPLQFMRLREQGPRRALHRHEFTELVIILGGRGTHRTREESFPLLAGDVFVITEDMAHGYADLEDLLIVNILFDAPRLRLDLGDLRQIPGYHALFHLEPAHRTRHRFRSRLRLRMDQLEHVAELLDRLEWEMSGRAPGYRCAARAALHTLLVTLTRAYTERPSPEARPLLRVADVVSEMERHPERPVVLEAMAEQAHMSVSTLLRTFRRALGVTPVEYLLKLRITRAMELLRQGDDSVSAIAARVGFDDPNYFTRQFRKVAGLPPREYRRRSRPGDGA